jgi:hypothetical protein
MNLGADATEVSMMSAANITVSGSRLYASASDAIALVLMCGLSHTAGVTTGPRGRCCGDWVSTSMSSARALVGSRSGTRPASIWMPAQRQRAEVHAGDARPVERTGPVSGAAAFHHALVDADYQINAQFGAGLERLCLARGVAET